MTGPTGQWSTGQSDAPLGKVSAGCCVPWASATPAYRPTPTRRRLGCAPSLDRLADAQLAEPRGPGRYGMHDLLRLFAREIVLEEESEQESRQAVERVLMWYLATARTATKAVATTRRTRLLDLGPETEQAGLALDSTDDVYAWVDAEARNLPAVVGQATTPELTVALATALYTPLHLRGRCGSRSSSGGSPSRPPFAPTMPAIRRSRTVTSAGR